MGTRETRQPMAQTGQPTGARAVCPAQKKSRGGVSSVPQLPQNL
jgi:hypothetical protein